MATFGIFPAAPGAEQAALRQGLSTARIPPLQRLLSDSTLVKDSPEPPVSQGWKNLPATWLTASPVGSRHPEQREEAAVDPEVDTSLDAQLTAAEQLQPLSMSERGRLYSAADNEEAQPDIEHTVAAEVRGWSRRARCPLLYKTLPDVQCLELSLSCILGLQIDTFQ